MRFTLLTLAACVAATPLAAQDYHFTHELAAGGRVQIDNINGDVDVSAATGRTVEVTVTKTVRHGDGALVKAVMEETGGGIRVCTVYLNRASSDQRGCDGDNGNDRHGDRLDVNMHYVVHVPAGSHLDVDNVNGEINVTGVDADASLEDVNGNVTFDGNSASSIETTNGKIIGRFSRASWEGSMKITTVNGSIDLTFPADLSAEVHGETVNGSIASDFPLTIEGKWGPKSFDGRIGNGGRRLSLETVNGGITLKKR